jgi:hypothetical protein
VPTTPTGPGSAPSAALRIVVGAVLGFMFTGGLLTLGFWIWSMVDGYQVAAGKGKPW